MAAVQTAIIGSGNIGSDLMVKILRGSSALEVAALVGVDPASEGLARAERLGVRTTAKGVAGLTKLPNFDEIEIVFDATTASAHRVNAGVLSPLGKRLIDLTPAAIGPFVVPAVNLDRARGQLNVNMVTCGGQATVPIVSAIDRESPVRYAEVIATISSRSAGPGTRANIDEFTQTTARALESVGGAQRGKAIIVLNPAEPPMLMRDTVLALVDADVDRQAVAASIDAMVADVAAYVPGYLRKSEVQFTEPAAGRSLRTLIGAEPQRRAWVQVGVYLEIEGAGHYLPPYAGNLDIMTSAAVRVAQSMADNLARATA